MQHWLLAFLNPQMQEAHLLLLLMTVFRMACFNLLGDTFVIALLYSRFLLDSSCVLLPLAIQQPTYSLHAECYVHPSNSGRTMHAPFLFSHHPQESGLLCLSRSYLYSRYSLAFRCAFESALMLHMDLLCLSCSYSFIPAVC